MTIFEISILGFTIAPTWYGLMYAIGFIICYFFLKKNINFHHSDQLNDLLFYVFLGVILGGRIGYVIFYQLDFFILYPLEIFAVWKGGMSFHGGFLGVVIAVILFSRRYQYNFWYIIDHIAIIVPVALGLGRIGNYINNELPGFSPYNGPLPIMLSGVYHFPSPLLAMILEGVLLFIVMFISWKFFAYKEKILSGVFLIGYSTARIISEQFRLPDTHIGYLFNTDFFTLGILYTIPMFLFGIFLIFDQKLRFSHFLATKIKYQSYFSKK